MTPPLNPVACSEPIALPGAPPSGLGESPFWWPDEQCLMWVDIPGRALHEWRGADARHRSWPLPEEPGCCIPLPGGDLLVAMRDGLFRFDRTNGKRSRVAPAPYDDPATTRFNDGKADPQGRVWIASMYEPRDKPLAALWRWCGDSWRPMVGDATIGNGLAWSADGTTMWWTDTTSHTIWAFDFDGADGRLSGRRVFAQFPTKDDVGEAAYGGRPDGAAVDVDGGLWVAMFEGGRVLRFAPDGTLVQTLRVPAKCPTMPCFGGADGRTMFITTARRNRPADELAELPLSGHVLMLRVGVAGLPVHHAAPLD